MTAPESVLPSLLFVLPLILARHRSRGVACVSDCGRTERFIWWLGGWHYLIPVLLVPGFS